VGLCYSLEEARCGVTDVLLIGLFLVCGPALAQSRPVDVPVPGSTVLAPAFADKLALSRIGWPSAAEQERARDAYTDRARGDAVRWITNILAPQFRPFPPPDQDPPDDVLRRDETGGIRRVPAAQDTPDSLRPKAREYRSHLTAAIGDDGADLMCARWATAAYHFQFIGAQELIRLSVEPLQPGPRGALSSKEAIARVQAFLDRVINDSARVLKFCTLKAESASYGYCVRVRCDDEQAWNKQFGPDETSLYSRWALHLVVHTDGVSFVLDVNPMWSAIVFKEQLEPLQRWFSPTPPRATLPPAPATAPDSHEVEAKLRLLKNLVDERTQQSRDQR
jgi:hypothetical protein